MKSAIIVLSLFVKLATAQDMREYYTINSEWKPVVYEQKYFLEQMIVKNGDTLDLEIREFAYLLSLPNGGTTNQAYRYNKRSQKLIQLTRSQYFTLLKRIEELERKITIASSK